MTSSPKRCHQFTREVPGRRISLPVYRRGAATSDNTLLPAGRQSFRWMPGSVEAHARRDGFTTGFVVGEGVEGSIAKTWVALEFRLPVQRRYGQLALAPDWNCASRGRTRSAILATAQSLEATGRAGRHWTSSSKMVRPRGLLIIDLGYKISDDRCRCGARSSTTRSRQRLERPKTRTSMATTKEEAIRAHPAVPATERERKRGRRSQSFSRSVLTRIFRGGWAAGEAEADVQLASSVLSATSCCDPCGRHLKPAPAKASAAKREPA